MELPTEDEIEVVISEFTHSYGHADGETCEICQMDDEFNRRCTEKHDLSVLDMLFTDAVPKVPEFALSLMIGGGAALREFSKLARFAFYLGYKCGRNHQSSQDLEKLLGE